MYKLLIVDDDEIICRGLGTCIAWGEHDIQVVGLAYDGEMALEYVRKEKPDIIIVDINMPFIDGMEFSYQIRQDYPEIKIIMLTAYKEFSYAQRAVQLQIFDYLTKPFTNNEVLEVVLRAAEKIQEEQKYRHEIGMNLELIREKNLEELTLYGMKDKAILNNCPILSADNFFQAAIIYLRRIVDMLDNKNNGGVEDEVECRLAISCIREWLADKKYCNMFSQNHRIVLVFEYQKRDESKSVRKNLETIIEKLGRGDTLFLTGGIGRAYQGINRLPVSYREAAAVIEQCYGYPNRSVIYYNDIRMKTGEAETELTSTKHEIQEYIHQRDCEKIQSKIHDFMHKIFQKQDVAFATEVFCIIELLRYSWECIDDKGKYERFIKQSGAILAKMMKTHSLTEVEEIAEIYFAEIYEYLRSRNTSDVEKRVNQAMDYIRENYSNPELSLEEVAREVNLSASYLGNCLKKFKNISYVNFLNQIRIENAKKMLAKPDTRSYEVAFLVGFNSSQYFSSCFKKSTGMTPGTYREQILHRKKQGD